MAEATLLCFPYVDRMVPDSYKVNNGEVATFFAGRPGRLGRSMLHADEIAGEIQDTLKAVASGAVTGAAATALVGVLPGLAVGVIFGTVHLAKKWHDYKQPYRFLSSLTHKGPAAGTC